jgi:DNA-binding NarL/FixJ family response regulator
MTSLRVLVVDDYEPFCRYLHAILQDSSFTVVGLSFDGLDAVQKAEELQPDLILLDIGLPQLSGLKAAKRISKVAPHSKILFISQEDSSDVVQAALSLGALGYVHKSRTNADLLPAIESVLAGRLFVSASLEIHQATSETNAQAPNRHEVLFYSEDGTLIDGAARFIAPALRTGNPAIVVATESHREALTQRLKENGFDLDGAIQEGKYISVDAIEVLAKVMVDGSPDHVQFLDSITDLIKSASKAVSKRSPRIAIFGECVNLLCAQGDTNAAITVEKLWNAVLETLDNNVDLLCGYQLSSLRPDEQKDAYDSICNEHSAIHV